MLLKNGRCIWLNISAELLYKLSLCSNISAIFQSDDETLNYRLKMKFLPKVYHVCTCGI